MWRDVFSTTAIGSEMMAGFTRLVCAEGDPHGNAALHRCHALAPYPPIVQAAGLGPTATRLQRRTLSAESRDEAAVFLGQRIWICSTLHSAAMR